VLFLNGLINFKEMSINPTIVFIPNYCVISRIKITGTIADSFIKKISDLAYNSDSYPSKTKITHP
jgi:hypothetical protein